MGNPPRASSASFLALTCILGLPATPAVILNKYYSKYLGNTLLRKYAGIRASLQKPTVLQGENPHKTTVLASIQRALGLLQDITVIQG